MNYIFDLDDTLIDNSDIVYEAVNQLFIQLIRKRNLSPVENDGKLTGRLKDYYAHHHFLKTKEYTDQGLIDLAPGVDQFLSNHKAFKAGHTNAPYRSTQYKLEKLGLEDLLDFVATPREFERKPNPEGINHIIERSGEPRENFIYVGDSLKDILTGRRADVRTIIISNDFKKKLAADEHYPTFQEFAKKH